MYHGTVDRIPYLEYHIILKDIAFIDQLLFV